jgi:hypothetical protein
METEFSMERTSTPSFQKKPNKPAKVGFIRRHPAILFFLLGLLGLALTLAGKQQLTANALARVLAGLEPPLQELNIYTESKDAFEFVGANYVLRPNKAGRYDVTVSYLDDEFARQLGSDTFTMPPMEANAIIDLISELPRLEPAYPHHLWLYLKQGFREPHSSMSTSHRLYRSLHLEWHFANGTKFSLETRFAGGDLWNLKIEGQPYPLQTKQFFSIVHQFLQKLDQPTRKVQFEEWKHRLTIKKR